MTPIITTDEQFLRDTADRIRAAISRTTHDIIEIGRDLIVAKDRLGHGNFLPWIEREFGMSEDTAQRFMRVAANIGDQIPHGAEFQPTALYALAAPSTPPEVREEIIERAQTGETITAKKVKALKHARVIDTNCHQQPTSKSAAQQKAGVIAFAKGVAHSGFLDTRPQLTRKLNGVRETQRSNIRRAISSLCGLPPAAEMARQMATDMMDTDSIVIDERLAKAVQWLNEFHQQWVKVKGGAEEKEVQQEAKALAQDHAADDAQEIASPPTTITTAPAGPARERAKAVLRQDPSLTKREVMERAECGSKAAVLARRELEHAGAIAPKANATETT